VIGSVVALALATVAPARAFAVDVHEAMTQRALLSSGLAVPVPSTPGQPFLPDVVRTHLDVRARASGTAEAWTARYPTPDHFDAWAYKEFLELAPEATVQGIDAITLPADRVFGGMSLLDVAAIGSKQPDDDFRNRDRFAYDADRKRISDANGNPVAVDPALTNMGNLGSLSSQAHAHYALADVEFSDDPEVLKTDPRRFAVPVNWEGAPIQTLAPEMAQTHVDLALLAALSDAPGREMVSWMMFGQAMHYVEDAGNPVHNVQVGLYDFFVDAFFARFELGLRTGGGYVGELRSLASIGIDFLQNHHTIGEEITRKRLVEAWKGDGTPEAEALLQALSEDDPDMVGKLDAALAPLGPHPEDGEFARVITEALADVGSGYGDDVYRVTRELAHPKYRKVGVVYDYDHDDPDDAVAAPSEENAATWAEFWSLQEAAFRRTGTCVRRIAALQQARIASAGDDPAKREALRTAVEDRLIQRQLTVLAAADERRARYLADPPVPSTARERAPGILAGEIVVLGLAVGVPVFFVVRGRPDAP
jgi:hypothetical protein